MSFTAGSSTGRRSCSRVWPPSLIAGSSMPARWAAAAAATWGIGALLRLLQVGNLQAYAFLFGLGDRRPHLLRTFSADGSVHRFSAQSLRRVLIMLGAPARKTALGRVGFDVCRGAISVCVSRPRSTPTSNTSHRLASSPEWRLSFTTRRRWLEPDHGAARQRSSRWPPSGSPARSRDMKTRFTPVFCSSPAARSARLLRSIYFSFTRFTSSR